MIRLHLLGATDLRDEQGREVTAVLAQPKRLALLAYLAAASPHGPQRRDTLLGLFWPELDQDHARNALNKSVYFIRQSLGEGALVSRGADELAFNEAVIWVDVREFSQVVDAGEMEAGLVLYRGDLLPSFFIPDAPEFERWLEQQRDRLRGRAAEAARILAERHEADRHLTEAIAYARRAVELSNGDERPVRRLIELLDRSGDRAGALHAYDSLARRLAAELETEPAAETVALAQRVRVSRPAGSAPVAGPSRDSTAPVAAASIPDSPVTQEAVLFAGTPPRRRALSSLGVAIAGVGLVGAFTASGVFQPNPPHGLDANLIAVAPVEVFDPSLAVWREGIVDILSRNLDGMGPLRTVSPTVAIKRWRGRAEAGTARELGRQTGAGLVLFGHLLQSGTDSVRLRVTLFDAGGGRTVGEVEVHESVDHMDRVLESVTLKLIQELGRTRPVGGVRPSSISARPLPALKAFLRGEQYYRRMSWDSALANYDHAISLDSGFALAYYRMAQVVGWESKQSKRYRHGDEYARLASSLNRGQTTRDSLLLAADPMGLVFDPDGPAFFEQRRRHWAALEEASRLYPGDPEVWYVIAESRYHTHADRTTFTQQLDAFDRVIELDPGFGPAYAHTVKLAIALGDPRRARRYAARYLSIAPVKRADPSLQLSALLLDPARASSAEAARLVDTMAGAQLWVTLWDFAHWPDSSETSLRLARALASAKGRSFVGAAPHIADSISRRKILARMLAFRGHLKEAYRTAPPYGFQWSVAWWHPFPSLALIGTVPADSASAVFGRLLKTDSLWPPEGYQQRALSWWNAARDTASLASFARRADSAGRRRENPVARQYFKVLADAARAYYTLVKGDSAAALRSFSVLPDSLCIVYECFYEKLTEARLASALGQDRKAADLLDRWVIGQLHVNPLGVLGTLERGRIAERLGQKELALKQYRFVADVWHNADPELQPYVTEARASLVRLREVDPSEQSARPQASD
jgi:eukaryotic-like serine/threonine-protein kinase